jgi:AcrR family transcriptional regulator
MPAAVRRELILESASQIFGIRGYAGTTTDQIAHEAGISQPYVVRMFGTKEKLFVEVLGRALGKLVVEFRTVIARVTAEGGDTDQLASELGLAYVDLIEDRGILLSLMQGFIQGHDRVIGECARNGFLTIYRLLRDEGHFDPSRVRQFLAEGMLFNTLLAIQLPESYGKDDSATELMTLAFGAKLQTVLGIAAPGRQRPVPSATSASSAAPVN